ncbi:MAG: NAD-dependent epimerase/dehydratase family protein [Lacisediminihabitans sp.]
MMNPEHNIPENAAGRRIALTGAAGSLASDIIPGLAERGYDIVCIDQRIPDDKFGCTWIACSVSNRNQLEQAVAGCEAVIHLAGIPLEHDWDTLMRVNIDGTQAVLETARKLGIGKVVLASSIHAAGYVAVPRERTKLPDDVIIRPNTFYGVSKAALEALGSMYHYRHGMDVICLRIASRFDKPQNERMLSTWLSPADAVRLFDAALSAKATGFRTIWGVSQNTRGYLSTAGGETIGFFAQDDAEQYAAEIYGAGDEDPSILASAWDRQYIGGIFCSPEPPQFTPDTLSMPDQSADSVEENRCASQS